MAKKITRRGFLKIGATSLAASVLAGCANPRRWVVLEPFVRPPEEQLTGQATWYASTCRQCPAGCGIIVRLMNGRAVKIEGNPEHPLNQGKLCARGQSGLQVLYNPDRIESPLGQAQRGSRIFNALTWDEALSTLESKLQTAGSQVVFWAGSTISTHLYDLFQRFSAAISAPTPILYDLYSAYHGYQILNQVNQDLFQQGGLPAYDISHADAVFSFGADFLGTWLSATRYGVEYGKFRNQPLGKRGYMVQLEPRMSTTGALADYWLPIRPGTEAQIAQAIARLIADQAIGSPDRVQRAQALAADVNVNSIASLSDISLQELQNLAHIFGSTERPLAIPGSPLVGQQQATAAVIAVQTLNLIAGTIDQPGGVWPSAGSQLPVPAKPAMSLYSDVQKLIAQMDAGNVQVLFIYGANPAYDLPGQAGFTKALAKVPFVVSFAPIVDETAVYADLILPDRTYLESWGYELASPNFDTQVISGQQPVVVPVYDNRSTADVILSLASKIPAASTALPWTDEVAFLKDTFSNLPAGAAGGENADVRWARFQQHGGWWPSAPALPAPAQPASLPPKASPLAAPQYQGDQAEFPYYLNLYMSELLSDGRGANQPWLQGVPDTNTSIAWQTWVEINPSTAQKLGVKEGDIVQIASPYGEVEALVYPYPAIRPDTVSIPLGQGHTDYGRYAKDRGSNAIALVGAQSGSNAENLVWDTVRVKITPTGKHKSLATFENTVGVTEGFINQAFPGQ